MRLFGCGFKRGCCKVWLLLRHVVSNEVAGFGERVLFRHWCRVGSRWGRHWVADSGIVPGFFGPCPFVQLCAFGCVFGIAADVGAAFVALARVSSVRDCRGGGFAFGMERAAGALGWGFWAERVGMPEEAILHLWAAGWCGVLVVLRSESEEVFYTSLREQSDSGLLTPYGPLPFNVVASSIKYTSACVIRRVGISTVSSK